MALRKLTKEEVLVVFEPEAEDMEIHGHFEDEDVARDVERAFNSGNVAAWFCAKVTVRWGRFSATQYLGACSYDSFEQFKEDAYYTDMVDTALSELNSDIEAAYREISPLVIAGQ